MAITPIRGTGKQLVKFVSPFNFVNFHGCSLNPVGTIGSDYNDAFANLDFYQVSFIGDPFTLDLDVMSPAHPNHEVVVSHTRLTASDMNDAPRPVTYTLKQEWKDPGGSTIFTFGPFDFTIGVGQSATSDFAIFSFMGWVNGEIDASGDYTCTHTITSTQDSNVTDTRTFTVNNALITDHEEGAGSEGHVWIDGNNLHYIDGEEFQHTILPSFADIITSDPGYLFIDDEDGTGHGDVNLAWTTETNRVNRSVKGQGGINQGGTPKSGHIWTGTTAFRQRGALLAMPDNGGGFANKFIRFDDGNGGT